MVNDEERHFDQFDKQLENNKQMAVVALAGLGTVAFHPSASALVASCGGQRKAFAQEVFIAAGNVGWSLPHSWRCP